MGMERLVLLLRESDALAGADTGADVYVVAVGDDARRAALAAVEAVRDRQPRLRIVQHTGGGSFKSQMKKADRSGARVALIWGEDEVAAATVTLKPLRGGEASTAQRSVPCGELDAALLTVLAE
jgi:histidyl-tRNA synthetase